MATAGYATAPLHPKVFIGKLDPVTGLGPYWPTRIATKNQAWPTTHPIFAGANQGWKRWWGHANGLSLTINDPQANIQTSDRGILGQISTGAHGIGLVSQSRTPIKEFVQWLNKLAVNTLSAVGGTAEVRTLTLTGTATAAGNAVIVIDNSVYTVAITSGDTAAAAATKIGTAANYTPAISGWTPSTSASTVVYTATSPGAHTGQFSITLPAGLTGSFATTTAGTAPTADPGETWFFDPNGEYGSIQRFTLGIESQTVPGQWTESALLVRVIVHQINQGGNQPWRFDDSGNDAPFSLSLAGQAEPRAVSDLELLNTNFAPTNTDPYGKATWWVAGLR